MLTPDTIVNECYRIIRYLAVGGCGVVYEAEDLIHKRTVALKQLRYVDPFYLRMFVHEHKRLADLHHPTFPEVYEPFEWQGGAFLPMEFFPGNNLREALRKHIEKHGEPFSLEQVLRWTFILLDALHYLHTRDPVYPIIHRDIKPENLKINKEQPINRTEIILLDFGLSKGIARGISQASAGESIVGYTRYYAPPEQELAHPNSAKLVSDYPHRARKFKEHPTDSRSDLYSLAATLYTLLTNAPPTAASDRAAHIWNNQPDPLRPIHEINSQVPADLSEIISRSMSFEPDDRYATANDMRDALMAAGFQQGDLTQRPKGPSGQVPDETTLFALPRVKYVTLGYCAAAVRSVAFSREGRYLASGSNDGAVRLWNVTTGEASILGYCDSGRTGLTYVSSVSFAPKGDRIASVSSDGVIRLWLKAPAGDDGVLVLAACRHTPRSVSFSPCGKRLVTGSSDGAVHLWDVASGASTLLGYCDGVVWSVAFTPDGASVAADSDDGTIRIWHLDSRHLSTLQSFDTDVRSIAFSPDGEFIAAAGSDGCIRIAEVGAHAMRELVVCDNVVRSLAFSPDSSKIVLGGEDRLVRLCDVHTGAICTLGECDDVVSSVAFSSNKRTVASGSWDKSIRLWDVFSVI